MSWLELVGAFLVGEMLQLSGTLSVQRGLFFAQRSVSFRAQVRNDRDRHGVKQSD